MQFKVPQDVQRADRILGPLTVRGFLTALAGGALAYMSYLLLDETTWPIVSILIAISTTAVIFLKIHDMTFSQYIYSMILYVFKPQKRLWVQHAGDLSIPLNIRDEVAKEDKKEAVRQKSEKSITALAHTLEEATASEKEKFMRAKNSKAK